MPSRRPKRSASPLTITGTVGLLILLALVFLYRSDLENVLPSQIQPPATRLTYTPGGQADPVVESLTAWFSDPLSGETSGGPDVPLIGAINSARDSVDIAIYNLTLQNLGDALIKAHKRGVTVRIVMESEAMDKSLPQKLIQAGIPIVGDQREGLMHNKFAIIDGQDVWTGSMNYAYASAYTDFNNLVRIRSLKMAQNYQINFEEMFTERKFGVGKRPNTPAPRVTVAESPVEVYFTPDDGARVHVQAEIKKAQRSIDFLAYSLTSDDIADAMIDRASAGVALRGVFDASQAASNTGGEFERMRRKDLDVHLDGIDGLMHHKVIIIDGQTVITGSYNFSNNAENTNDENLVIIHNRRIAELFLEHFEKVYSSAE